MLYVYAARIFISWELPTGWVSWLVVALMAGCIAIEFGLYPVRIQEETYKRMDCALVARFSIADAGTDDNRHYTPLQRLRRHHQSPLPYNSQHLVLHCLYRTRLH